MRTAEEPAKKLVPEWPALREDPAKGHSEPETEPEAELEAEPEAEPRRRLASLALASGTGEDIAALAMKGPRPRMRLTMKPFRVLVVFLAVLLVVLWGWLALRIGPSSELALGDGPESSSLAEANDGGGKGNGEKSADDEAQSAPDSSDSRPNQDKAAAQDGARYPSSGAAESNAGPESSGTSGVVVVYVSGAVQQPGVYTLPASSRVNDAVTAAGGMTENADPAGINLAAPLEDSQHVHIPEPGEAPVAGTSGSSSGNSPAVPASGSAGTSVGSDGLVNINTAGEAELQELTGIGPALASAIVQWRDEHGSFSLVDDLLDVPGVGPAKLSQLREHATV